MNLPVPYRKQQTESSCFPACIRMILRYYKDDIDEKWLWKKGQAKGHTGTWDIFLEPILRKKGYKCTSYWDGIIEGWNIPKETTEFYKKEYPKAIKKGFVHKKGASIQLIKKYLNKRVPVLAEIHADKYYGKKCGWTHIIVIHGYTKKHLMTHDPDKTLGGKNKEVTTKRFLKAWTKLSPRCGRSLFIIEKNKS